MTTALANGLHVVRGKITESELGAWTGRIEVDDEDGEITGPVTISIGGVSWVGTVMPERGGIESGRFIAFVVGGNNGLTTELPPKYYYQATLATIIADIMTECGETFDAASSDPSIATYQVPRWMRARGEARMALNAVANELGGYWRVNRAGHVVMVKDDLWTVVEGEYSEVAREPAARVVAIAPEEPFACPGVTVGEDRVVSTVTEWNGDSLRQALVTHDGTDKVQDVLSIGMENARRANELAVVYGRQYPSKVVAQDADGTLHLLPDDPRMGFLGLTQVPMRHGIPGLTVKVVPGQYVNLFFEGGDPKKPAAALWPDGSSVLEVELQSTAKNTFVAPLTAIGPSAEPTQSFVRGEALVAYLDAFFTALTTALATITPGSATTGGASAVTSLNGAKAGLDALKQAALSVAIKGE